MEKLPPAETLGKGGPEACWAIPAEGNAQIHPLSGSDLMAIRAEPNATPFAVAETPANEDQETSTDAFITVILNWRGGEN